MKKVLFVCYGMGVGGIEKCLVNLINVMSEEKYKVDILLMNPEYALKSEVKTSVKYLDSYDYVMNTTDTIKEIKRRGGIKGNIQKFHRYCLFRLMVKFCGKAWKIFSPTKDEYDIAIAYSHHDYSSYYVIDKVKAKRKVLWFHNGIYTGNRMRYYWDKIYYPQFDYIVAVSKDCEEILKNKFSFKTGQLIVLRNICDADQIKKWSFEYYPENFIEGRIHIVTVGRLTKEKGIDIALDACELIVKKGYKICWHWIGDGNMKEDSQNKIKEKELEQYFILEGEKANPYPYIRKCEIYVQPSYYEAYSTTVTEAKILCKPIIVTDVGGMREQIVENETGIITPVGADFLAQGIIRLIDDKVLQRKMISQLKKEMIDITEYLNEYEHTIFN